MTKRGDYQEHMEERLGQWRIRLETLRRQAANDVNVELHEQLEDWRAGGKAALSKLGELKAATGESWDIVKLELEKLWHKIEKVLGTATPAAPVLRVAPEPAAGDVKGT